MNKVKRIIIIVVLIMLAFGYSYIDKQHDIYNSEIDSSEYINTGILLNETLEQEFLCTEETLSGIRVKCAAYGEREDVDVQFEICRDDGAIVCQKKIKGSEFENNKFFEVSFKDIDRCKNEKMHLKMVFTGGDEADGLGIYVANSEEGDQYYRNSRLADGTLLVRTVTHRFDFETFFVVLLFEVYLVVFMRIMSKLFK